MEHLISLAHQALYHPHDHEWSVQGFGMIRTYLTTEGEEPSVRLILSIWLSV